MGMVLLCGGMILGGCNVFEGAAPEPETVDALLADARSALTAGKESRAVRLLEQAFEKDSTDIRVRVELANALYAEQGLDVFALRAAVEHLSGPSDSSSTSGALSRTGEQNQRICTNDAQPDSAEGRYASIPTNADVIRRWVGHGDLVERVRGLVVTGGLQRTSAFASTDASIRRKGLLLGAVSVVGTSVIQVHEVFEPSGTALYRDRRGASPAFVACAGSEATLESANDVLCELAGTAGQATEWLRERGRLSGGGEEASLVGQLESVEEGAGARMPCSTASG